MSVSSDAPRTSRQAREKMLPSRLRVTASSTIALTLKVAPAWRGVRRKLLRPSRTTIGWFRRLRSSLATLARAWERSSPPTSMPPTRTPSAIWSSRVES
jgi:hypothetical protein